MIRFLYKIVALGGPFFMGAEPSGLPVDTASPTTARSLTTRQIIAIARKIG